MPKVLQWSSYLVPLTYFLTIVRGIIIKGVGLEYLWPQNRPVDAFRFCRIYDGGVALPQAHCVE